MNIYRKIALEKVLSKKQKSSFIITVLAFSTAALFTAFSLSKNFFDFFLKNVNFLSERSVYQVIKNGFSNIFEILKYILLSNQSDELLSEIEVDNLSETIFTAETTVENLPAGIVMMIVITLLIICITLSIMFSICRKEKRKFCATLLASGSDYDQIKSYIFYESFYFSLVSIPIGLVIGCIEIYMIKFISTKIFDKIFSNYGNFAFPVEIKGSLIAALIVIPILFLMTWGFSAKVCKKLSIKNVTNEIKNRMVPDIGISVFSADPRYYKNKGFEKFIASRNMMNNLAEYLKIFFMTFIYTSILSVTTLIFNSIRAYNGQEIFKADKSLLVFSYASQIYFCAIAAVVAITTIVSIFNVVYANISSNTGIYALMRSSGTEMKSILRTVKKEGIICVFAGIGVCILFLTILFSYSMTIISYSMQLLTNKNILILLLVITASLLLFAVCVMSTNLVTKRKMKNLDVIATLKDLLY